MSRGDCMTNKYVVKQYTELYDHLESISENNGYGKIKMNLSSIYPYTLRPYKLSDVFKGRQVNFYYSIYTLDREWRRVNMPNAMDPDFALDRLRELQENHKDNTVVFHCAFIKDSNDSIESVQKMADKITSLNFPRTKFNLVRYNPPPNGNSTETDIDRLNTIFSIMNSAVTNKVDTQKSRIVNRVAPDIYVSCGMFSSSLDSSLELLNEKINEQD
jgi:adenine C2-methylase RlmN of 23S rRNA A2503 and tRNA A37